MASESKGLNRLKKLAKEIPDERRVLKLLRSLTSVDHHAADRAAAIVGGALLEAALGTAIEAKFVIPLNKKTERPQIFDGDKNGPLATFSARIRVGYALGVFGPETREELHSIKAIRNAFAHGAMRLKFATPEIAEICASLRLFEKSGVSEQLTGNTTKERFISTVAFISSRLARNLSAPRGYLQLTQVMIQWGQLT